VTRRTLVIGLACAALTAGAAFGAVAAASGSAGAGGPLTLVMAGRQPAFPVDSGGGAPGVPADFYVQVIDTAPGPVTLVSASLIPVIGHPAGRLAFLAIPLRRGNGIVGHGFPPLFKLPTRPFKGAQLRHGLSSVVFGIEGPNHRIYMVAGLRITYRYRGQLYSVNAWSASTDCMNVSQVMCKRAGEIDRRATEQLAGV
jgi:hypothetical protein